MLQLTVLRAIAAKENINIFFFLLKKSFFLEHKYFCNNLFPHITLEQHILSTRSLMYFFQFLVMTVEAIMLKINNLAYH